MFLEEIEDCQERSKHPGLGFMQADDKVGLSKSPPGSTWGRSRSESRVSLQLPQPLTSVSCHPTADAEIVTFNIYDFTMSGQTELREPTYQAGPAAQGIRIQHFSERITVWPEDWSGISDPKLRRKLQNRLNQRALRKYCS
jgi:hypothetical protein